MAYPATWTRASTFRFAVLSAGSTLEAPDLDTRYFFESLSTLAEDSERIRFEREPVWEFDRESTMSSGVTGFTHVS